MLPTETYDLFVQMYLHKFHMELTQNTLYYSVITNKIHTKTSKQKAKMKLRYMFTCTFFLFYFIINSLYTI